MKRKTIKDHYTLIINFKHVSRLEEKLSFSFGIKIIVKISEIFDYVHLSSILCGINPREPNDALIFF